MTVLIAALAPTIRVVKRIFGQSAVIRSATSVAEAVQILEGGVDLALCSLQFDESRMFDLLLAAKSDAALSSIPFVCFRSLHSVLDAEAVRSLDIACKANGSQFIDLADLRRRFGTVVAEEIFRTSVLSRCSEVAKPPAGRPRAARRGPTGSWSAAGAGWRSRSSAI